MTAYIDLSKKHGHRDDHGFACGAEFNVKIRRRPNIPDFVREQLSQAQIDDMWWTEAERSRDALRDALQRRYKWIGALAFVGRGPGWLAIEDTNCGSRNWDTIGKVVDQHLKSFIRSMEDSSFWSEVAGVSATTPTAHHATRKASTMKSMARTYTVHGYVKNREGTPIALWTRTRNTKAQAQKLAKEQRAQPGGVARIVEEKELPPAYGRPGDPPPSFPRARRHHAMKKSPAQLQREIDEALGGKRSRP